MSEPTIRDEMTAIGDEAHSQRASQLSTLEDIQTALANINSDMLLMRQSLLRAVAQGDPCATCPPASLVTPPTSDTTSPVSDDTCKRAQAFIHAIHEIAGVLGAAADSGVSWAPSVVISGISEVVTTLMDGGTVPLPSFVEAVEIGGELITYAVANLFRHDSLQAQFDSVSSSMLAPLAFSSSGAQAQSTYLALIGASGLDADETTLLGGLAFNALCSFFFDPSGTPDLSGYDGGACGVALHNLTACAVFDATPATADGAAWYAIQVPVHYVTGNDDFMITGDYNGWSIELLSAGVGKSIRVRYWSMSNTDEAEGYLSSGAPSLTFGHATQAMEIYTNDHDSGAEPFTVRICPPGMS